MDDPTKLLWIERVMNVSALFVAIGVSGEFIGNWIASPIRKRLDAASQKEIAVLQREAAGLRVELEREIQKHAPRTLADAQKVILTAELRGKIPKVTFVVQRDLESRWFALQLEITLQEAGAKLSVFEMAPGEIMPIPAGVLMYRPGGATSEEELKGDPLYIALTKANLFGGTAAQPFASLERGPQGPMLPSDGYIVYVGQKLP